MENIDDKKKIKISIEQNDSDSIQSQTGLKQKKASSISQRSNMFSRHSQSVQHVNSNSTSERPFGKTKTRTKGSPAKHKRLGKRSSDGLSSQKGCGEPDDNLLVENSSNASRRSHATIANLNHKRSKQDRRNRSKTGYIKATKGGGMRIDDSDCSVRSRLSAKVDGIEVVDLAQDDANPEGEIPMIITDGDKSAYWQELEQRRMTEMKKERLSQAAASLPQSAMNKLGVQFDVFDPHSKCQIFIDKVSAVPQSDQSSQNESDINHSHTTQELESARDTAEAMCRVLEKPQKQRGQEEIKRILPMFKSLDAFEKLKDYECKGAVLPDGFFSKILQSCFIERYSKGEYVCHEGEKGDKFYINLYGAVQFLKNDLEKTRQLEQLKRSEAESQKGNTVSFTHKSSCDVSQPNRSRTQSKRGSIGVNAATLSKHVSSPAPHLNEAQIDKMSRQNSRLKRKTTTVSQQKRLSHLTKNETTMQSNAVNDTIKSEAPNVSKFGQQDDVNIMVLKELGRGEAGGMFGELAIVNQTAGRAASVRCLKDCIFIVLCGRDYSRYLRRVIEKLDDDKIEFLKGMPIFEKWARGTMRSFLNNIKTHTYPKTHRILNQGGDSNFIYIMYKGTVQASLKVKKPFSDTDSSVNMLRQEKYKLKDSIHSIQRNTKESLEKQNYFIEGDGAGMMGAKDGWPQLPQDAIAYKQRMQIHEQEQQEGVLRQRLLVLDDKKDKISDAKRQYWVNDHSLTQLMEGQVFNEEGVLLNQVPSQYSFTVTSETAEIWMINAFQFKKRLDLVPETKMELWSSMQTKARQVFELCQTQATWSLTNADSYSEFYKQVFDKKEDQIDINPVVLASGGVNDQLKAETQVFYRQAGNKKDFQETINDNQDDMKVKGREKILKRNLELLHSKVEQMDQFESTVDMQPLNKGYLPQMENKKRYYEVQRVVSPNKSKGQKPVKIFKEEEFMKEAIFEANLAGQFGQKPQKASSNSLNKGISRHKNNQSLLRHDLLLAKLKNIEGGGALINGRTLDQRAVMKEIVKGYPMVDQQTQIHLRDIALQLRDKNGVLIHKTPEMFLEQPYTDDQTEFEKVLYKAFEESQDPMQLVKILKRKLSMSDQEHGSAYVKLLDDMIQKEPLRKFVLFAKKCYFSNTMNEQIAKIHSMKGNEKAVYQNDLEYQTQMNLKKKPLPPKKLSYFQQQLQQKHQEARLQYNIIQSQSLALSRYQSMSQQNSQSFADRTTKQPHKIELTIKPVQIQQNEQQQTFHKQPQSSQNKTPIFESKELQKLFSNAEQLKQLTTPPEQQSMIDESRIDSQAQNTIDHIPHDIKTQHLESKMLDQSQLSGKLGKTVLLSDDQEKNNTARITYQGDQDSLDQREDLLDIPLIKGDFENKTTQMMQNNRSPLNISESKVSKLQKDRTQESANFGVISVNDQHAHKLNEPLLMGPITTHQSVQRPSTSIAHRHRQANCKSKLSFEGNNSSSTKMDVTSGGRPSQSKAQAIQNGPYVNNNKFANLRRQNSKMQQTQVPVRQAAMNSPDITSHHRMMSQMAEYQLNTKSGFFNLIPQQNQSVMLYSNMQSEQNLVQNKKRQRNQAQIANARSALNHADIHKTSFSRIGKRVPSHGSKSLLENLTAASSAAGYSRTGRMASQIVNQQRRNSHIHMQVASLRRKPTAN